MPIYQKAGGLLPGRTKLTCTSIKWSWTLQAPLVEDQKKADQAFRYRQRAHPVSLVWELCPRL